MSIDELRSVVGIDPTPRGIAFVFFERGELLDWGTHTTGATLEEMLALLGRILDGLAADIVVLEDAEAAGSMRRGRIQQFLRAAEGHARQLRVRTMTVSRVEARRAWSARGISNKQALARELAGHFPEISHLVPPPRKSYQQEDARVNIFDALTLVLCAFQTLPPLGR